jgi:hypothetical protein
MLLAAINLPLALRFQDYHEGYQVLDILEKFGIGGVKMIEAGFAKRHIFMYYTGDLYDDVNVEFHNSLLQEVNDFNNNL